MPDGHRSDHRNRRTDGSDVAEEVRAELVANIARVVVQVGDRVEPGEMVVLLESMKMEIPMLAETGGTVTAIHVREGDVVQEGDVVVVLD
jgi:acetyl-CoA carboxylase biotin carboxyl carrier protein